MWPFSKGSVQPIKCTPLVARPKFRSAPQLSIPRSFPTEESAVSVEPRVGRCEDRLLSQDQLTTLGLLPDQQAVQYLRDCIADDTPYSATLALLLYTVYRWTLGNDFDTDETAVLLTLYYRTARYFLGSPWRTQAAAYSLLRESLLRCSVQHAPAAELLLRPGHCRAALLLFCRHLAVLPLLRQVELPNTRLGLHWLADNNIS